MSVLAGGVFAASSDDELAELRGLVDDIGRQAAGHRLPENFDTGVWAHLEETGLSRITTGEGAGPVESAVVLRELARHAVAAPVAETDLLAAWLASATGLDVPADGPLTVAIADADAEGTRLTGTAYEVPWTRAAARVVLVLCAGGRWHAASVEPGDLDITDGHNLAGEPRDTVAFDVAGTEVDAEVVTELKRRGAWARCVQIIGALDAAAEMSVAHTRDRVQFGKPLSRFQSVQHALAGMAGEIERARASVSLAVEAAAEHGFADPATDYAVTLAKIVTGRVVPVVNTVAHQLHGAIGVTVEHRLWSATSRSYSWAGEFGSTQSFARRLGRVALTSSADDGALWDVLTGVDLRAWS
ncbi:acyl-CoA dehydrogenase [Mycobacterium sp. MS1601]|uniref:acyl-CoA dehydrogenase family protein n=1 Tax=Mycobacterium sp. MS1601 TaxID=1936029 RepID=UPI0009792407|nr:acyl-CoA dehydrogenase family protein [Mycobacterium sp. MS1601]AQA03563.1 acyl-CoA dehydrogenase [Mycobacterium sp. MS1601]